jgi:hypothetical protein
MQEILTVPSPYNLIKEAEGLIKTVDATNSGLVAASRTQACEKINKYIATLIKDLEAPNGDAGLRLACVNPLELLRGKVETEESLAHITQAETEALKAFDAALLRIDEYVRRVAEREETTSYKKHRIVEPARLVKAAYLETLDDVNTFLDTLRQELEHAIRQNERVQIR